MDVFLKEVKDQNIGKIEEDVFLSNTRLIKLAGLLNVLFILRIFQSWFNL